MTTTTSERVEPTLDDARTAAKALASAGAQQVLWHDPIPGGEYDFDPMWDNPPSGLVVIVDELNYAERYRKVSEFADIAKVATGKTFVEVHVTDVPEWAHRSKKVVTSFEAWAASNSICLHARDPAGVLWSKEIGMAYSSEQEAQRLLASLQLSLQANCYQIQTLPPTGEFGNNPLLRRNMTIMSVSQAHMGIELGLKILCHLGDHGHADRVHDFAELLEALTGAHKQEAIEILKPLRWHDGKYINWRVVGIYCVGNDEFSDELALVGDDYLATISSVAAEMALFALEAAGKKLNKSFRPQIEEVISQALDLRSQLKTSLK